MTETSLAPAAPLTLADEVRLTQLPAPAIRKEIRTRARVSLRRLAREVGVTHGSIYYYEGGGQPAPDIAIRYRQILELLAEATGIDIGRPAVKENAA